MRSSMWWIVAAGAAVLVIAAIVYADGSGGLLGRFGIKPR